MPGEYSKDALAEQPAFALFSDMHGETANHYTESFLSGGDLQGRETPEEVVLIQSLCPLFIP